MKIKEIPLENRPRERMFRNGVNVLSDAELLAVILQNGTKGENVVDMSNRIIKEYGLDSLNNLSITELSKIKGIGMAKAMKIKALFELNRRVKVHKNNFQIKCAEDVFEYSSKRILSNDKEYFIVLMLDSKNRLIRDEIVSIGTLNSSIVHPREIFKSAIKESANSVILVHNHPSGDCTPSDEDKQITKLIFEAGDLLNIKVMDHIIISQGGYWSFKEND